MELLEAIRAVGRWSDGKDEERPRDAIAALRKASLKDMLRALDDLDMPEYNRLAAFATTSIGGYAGIFDAANRGSLPIPFVRERAGLNQEDLAADLGVSVSTVRRWESDDPRYQPTPDQAARIAAHALRMNGLAHMLMERADRASAILLEAGLLFPEGEEEALPRSLDFYRDQDAFDAEKRALDFSDSKEPPWIYSDNPDAETMWREREARAPLDVQSYAEQNAAVLTACAIMDEDGHPYSIAIH